MRRLAFALLAVSLAHAAGAVTLITRHLEPGSQDHFVQLEALSLDGRHVLVSSADNDLVPEEDRDGPGVFAYDLTQGTVEHLSAFGELTPARVRFTGDKRFAVSGDGAIVVGIVGGHEEAAVLRYDRRSEQLDTLSSGVPSAGPADYVGYRLSQAGLAGRRVAVTRFRAYRTALSYLIDPAGQFILGERDPIVPDTSFDAFSLDVRFGFTRIEPGLRRIDLVDGTHVDLEPVPPGPFRSSGNGRFLIYAGSGPSGNSRLVRRNVQTGSETVLASSADGFGNVAVSISGDAVLFSRYDAFTANRSYWVWSRGQVIALDQLAGTDLDRVSMSADGQLFAGVERDSGALFGLDLATGSVTTVEPDGGSIIDLRAATDRIVFTARGPIAGVDEAIHPQAVNAFSLSRTEINGPAPVRAKLEAPGPGAIFSGIGTIRGWAFSPEEPIRSIEFGIDGEGYGELPLGGPRDDVGSAFPGSPGAAASGFAAAFNFNDLAPGLHELEIRITTAAGLSERRHVAFLSAPATSGFLADPRAVDLSTASTTIIDNRVELRDVLIDGTPTTLELAWNPATQSFEIVSVVHSSSSSQE